MTRAAALLGLAGLFAATALIAREGFATVFGALAAAGAGVVWASLLHVVPMTLNARAWQRLVARGGRRRRGGGGRPRARSLPFFTYLVWIREAVNGLLPVARVGGEIASVRLMRARGMRIAPAVASLVVDMTIGLATQLVFTVVGVALMLGRWGGGPLVKYAALGIGVGTPLVLLLVMAQRRGIFGGLGSLVRAASAGRLAAFAEGAPRVDRAVNAIYGRRARLIACAGWQLAGWVAGAGEIWLVLAFMGTPIAVADAVLVEALVQALSSAAFVVPGALGVQEGAFVALGAVVGLGPETALAVALSRRARDLMLFLPALAVYQAVEGRRYFAGEARPHR